MPAYAHRESITRPRERTIAFAAVALVQAALAVVLVSGLRVDVRKTAEAAQRLIDITLAKPPPVPPPAETQSKVERSQPAAPKAQPDRLGGSPGPKPAHAPPSVTPIVAVQPTASPSG